MTVTPNSPLRRVRTLGAGVLMATVVVACGPDAGNDEPEDTTTTAAVSAETAAALELCPTMWTWVKEVGAAFNAASELMLDMESGEDRHQRWLAALDDIAELNTALGDTVATMDLPVTAPLADDVALGLEKSNATLDELRRHVVDTPEIDQERPQVRASQLVVRVEKVIDVAKPELADYGDAQLIEAFKDVPSCQFSLKDADDGKVKFNG